MEGNKLEVNAGALAGAPVKVAGVALVTAIVGGVKQLFMGLEEDDDDISDYNPDDVEIGDHERERLNWRDWEKEEEKGWDYPEDHEILNNTKADCYRAYMMCEGTPEECDAEL